MTERRRAAAAATAARSMHQRAPQRPGIAPVRKAAARRAAVPWTFGSRSAACVRVYGSGDGGGGAGRQPKVPRHAQEDIIVTRRSASTVVTTHTQRFVRGSATGARRGPGTGAHTGVRAGASMDALVRPSSQKLRRENSARSLDIALQATVNVLTAHPSRCRKQWK